MFIFKLLIVTLKLFLGTNKSKKEIEKDIKTGVYKLARLNKI